MYQVVYRYIVYQVVYRNIVYQVVYRYIVYQVVYRYIVSSSVKFRTSICMYNPEYVLAHKCIAFLLLLPSSYPLTSSSVIALCEPCDDDLPIPPSLPRLPVETNSPPPRLGLGSLSANPAPVPAPAGPGPSPAPHFSFGDPGEVLGAGEEKWPGMLGLGLELGLGLGLGLG